MAYNAEINVSVKNLKQVADLEAKLSSISRSVNALNKGTGGGRRGGGGGSAKAELSDEQKLIQLENKRLTIQNRGLGVTRQVIDLQTKGKNLDEATNNLAKVKSLTDQDQLDLAKNKILLADQQVKKKGIELKVERDINAEASKRAKFLKGAPTGFTAAQFGPQMAPTKGAGQAAMSIDTITKQSDKRLRIELKLRELEAKGVNTAKLRVKMGDLVDAQNRKDFGTIKRINREIGRGIAKEESKLKILQLQNKERAKAIKSNARMEAIRQGNFAGSGPGVFGPQPRPSFAQKIGIKRGFDVQSAMISGGFPLLFGQGPVTAAAGALGGGIGGMFGQMGGFAGGIAATAIVQSISSAVNAIKELGQALGPFTQNAQAVTDALGLQGSAQEAQIKLIEQLEGKTAAFNAASKLMAREIGQGGVDALEKFGETSRLAAGEFARLVLHLQAVTARVLNFTNEILGLTDALEKSEARNLVSSAAAGGSKEAQGLATERENQGFFSKLDNAINNSFFGKILTHPLVPGGPMVGDIAEFGSVLSGQKAGDEDLSKREQIFAVGEKTKIQAGAIVNEGKITLKQLNEEIDLRERIKQNEQSMSTALAEKVSRVQQEFDLRKETLDMELKKLTENRNKIKEKAMENGKINEDEQLAIDIANKKLDTQKEIIEGIVNTKLKAVDATIKLHEATTDMGTAFEKIGESIASGVSDNLTAAILQTKTLGDAAKSILNDLANTLIRLGVNTLLSGIPGFGGLPNLLGGKARGGPVTKNGSFVVGEKGPELFVPKRSGTIIPNDKLGGGSTNINVNIDASGSSVEGDAQQSKELGRAISVAIQSELLKQRRPGGLLR